MSVIDCVNITTTFKVITCFKCELPFAVTSETKSKWIESHRWFYCPSCGQTQHYTGETEASRLQAVLEKTQRELKWQTEYKEEYRKKADKAIRKLTATKGHITRMKNRIGNGVCPCCNRTFKNVHNHMKTQHPEFKKENA